MSKNYQTLNSASSSTTHHLKQGDYAPAKPGDSRSPCPLLNAMANHGYLPRDGRNIRPDELKKAMDLTGLSNLMGSTLAYPTYLEDVPKIAAMKQPSEAESSKRSFFARLWYLIRHPWALLFPQFGVWLPGRKDYKGTKVVDLDQVASHNRIEHDISMTRRDIRQGDNNTLQKDLVKQFLDSSSDGRNITLEDMCKFQRQRILDQCKDNPHAEYGPNEHKIACGQIAMTLRAFGNGKSIPCDYAKALFQEERLPIAEGWKRRRWWTLGLVEVVTAIQTINKLVGLNIEA